MEVEEVQNLVEGHEDIQEDVQHLEAQDEIEIIGHAPQSMDTFFLPFPLYLHYFSLYFMFYQEMVPPGHCIQFLPHIAACSFLWTLSLLLF